MKKCFTINQNRTKEDFIVYKKILEDGLYQGVEIFYPYNISLDRQEAYTNNVKELINTIPTLEVVMHLPFGNNNSLCDLDNYSTILQRMKDGIVYTSQFNTKKLTLHLGDVDKNIDREIYINHIVIVLKELCSFANEYNMNVMIENMPGFGELGYSPNELKNIFEKVNMPNIRFILDTGHANVSDYEIEEYIYLLKEYLYHIHFSDNSGKTDEHKRIGLGIIDFNKVFFALNKVKYNQLLCIEVIYNNPNDLIEFCNDLNKYDK